MRHERVRSRASLFVRSSRSISIARPELDIFHRAAFVKSLLHIQFRNERTGIIISGLYLKFNISQEPLCGFYSFKAKAKEYFFRTVRTCSRHFLLIWFLNPSLSSWFIMVKEQKQYKQQRCLRDGLVESIWGSHFHKKTKTLRDFEALLAIY